MTAKKKRMTAAAKAQLRTYGRDKERSPSRKKTGKNGKLKVTRIQITCVCGHEYDLLCSNKERAMALCPRCKFLAVEVRGNPKHDTIAFKIITRQCIQEMK